MGLFDTHAHYDSGAFNADRLRCWPPCQTEGWS